jgi:type VI secretion system protein ImpK
MLLFDSPTRLDNMALIFQELLTIIMRLRTDRQRVFDAEVFRNQIRNTLKAAETEAIRRGYTPEDLRMGMFAVVAFLDESIGYSKMPALEEWRQRPLQEELFGVTTAGELFFRNVERLLSRPDSETLSDLLEVHQICLLLGFHGRYREGGAKPEIRGILAQIEEKIGDIRGAGQALEWRPPPERVPNANGYRWTQAFTLSAIGCVAFAVLLFILFKALLASSMVELNDIAGGVSF